LNLISKLKKKQKITFLYVTHNLTNTHYITNNILIIYTKQIIKHNPIENVLSTPLHPYTQLLLNIIPNPTTNTKNPKIELKKNNTSTTINPNKKYHFRIQYPLAIDIYSHTTPQLIKKQPKHTTHYHITTPSTN